MIFQRSLSLLACLCFIKIVNPAPIESPLDNALQTFLAEISPDIEAVSQAQVVNYDLIPSLSKLLRDFTNTNEDVAIQDLDRVIGQVAEDILLSGSDICGEKIQLAPELADNLLGDDAGVEEDCFRQDSRLSGTDISGSVISKNKQPTVEDCQKKCFETDECNFFLYFDQDHYRPP